MDVVALLQIGIDALGKSGPAAKWVTLAVMAVLSIPSLITAFVGLWHSLVQMAVAIEKVLPAAQGIADKLKAGQGVVDSKSSALLNIVNRLSALKPPQSK